MISISNINVLQIISYTSNIIIYMFGIMKIFIDSVVLILDFLTVKFFFFLNQIDANVGKSVYSIIQYLNNDQLVYITHGCFFVDMFLLRLMLIEGSNQGCSNLKK